LDNISAFYIRFYFTHSRNRQVYYNGTHTQIFTSTFTNYTTTLELPFTPSVLVVSPIIAAMNISGILSVYKRQDFVHIQRQVIAIIK